MFYVYEESDWTCISTQAQAECVTDHGGKFDYDSSLADPEAGARIGDDGAYLSQEIGGWPQKNPATQKISVVKTPKDLNDEEFWIAGRQGYLQAWFSQDKAKELEFKAEIFNTTEDLEAVHPNLKVNWDFKNIEGKLDPE
ncbi:hypothetical protein SCARD494_10115 [Seiridium cardinale]